MGRGVQELVDAMELLPDCRLVVAGNGDLWEQLKQYSAQLAWGDRIAFLGRVEPARLHTLTLQADLGVCLLEDLGLNYRYALPNRIADFAHAGVPILATDFVEMGRVIRQYHTGALTEACPKEKEGPEYRDYVERLATTIKSTLTYWENLPKEEKERRFEQARKELNWEKEKKVLTETLDAII